MLVRPTEWPSPKPSVSYHDFVYQAQSWNVSRRVVAKVLWHQGEVFPRVGFIVTNLTYPTIGIVRFYNGRGTAEQWIKEGKYALNWTRLSCHKVVANQVRLGLFVMAYNLGNFLRRLAVPEEMKHWSLTSHQTRMIKTGGRLVRHARRLVFQLAEVLVRREMLGGILERIGRLRAGSWLVHFRSVGIDYGYRVVQGKRASQGRDLVVDKRFGDFTLGRTVVGP